MKYISAIRVGALVLLCAVPSGVFAQALYSDTTIGASAGIQTGGIEAETETNADISQNATLHSEGIMEESTTSVQVSDDAETYMQDTADMAEVSDARIDNENRVHVTYQHPGKLFGIFSVHVGSETVVEKDTTGELTVHTRMPWWSMFVTGLGGISEQVNERLYANAETSSDIQIADDREAQARLINAIIEAHTEAQAYVATEDI